MTNTRARGALGERIAEAFLALRGYRVVDRNRWGGRREIDLLVHDGRRLVAVEVKLRRGGAYGRAVEAADRRKLARVRAALSAIAPGVPARIDVVAIDVAPGGDEMTVRHYPGAWTDIG